jgi:acyl phosphate:glycerol-3-phosphate acyltransferase
METTPDIVRIALVILVSYLLGSIPTAYLIGRIQKINIFEVGSGNMGATNISRSMGIGWGLLTWFFDSIKGIIAILISAQLIMPDNWELATTLSAIAAVVGHNWSAIVVLITGTLRGGKGAATAFGTLLWIAPVQALVGVAIAIAIVMLTRYVSLGVLVLFGIATVWTTVLTAQGLLAPIFLLYSIVIAALIFIRFRENIEKLLAGTERKLGERA